MLWILSALHKLLSSNRVLCRRNTCSGFFQLRINCCRAIVSHAGATDALNFFSAVTTATNQAVSETSAANAVEFFSCVRAAISV